MSSHSGNESCHENGGSSDGMREDLVSSDLDPASISESAKSDGANADGAKADRDRLSSPCPTSPVPGTSKSTGVRRRTSKEPKRNSPDPVEGDLHALVCI